jgi:CheY-like chemotaxis protein
VLQASLPSEAREKYARGSERIDLLLSDIRMPESSGPELARDLRVVAPDLRVLLMSGYSGRPDDLDDRTVAGARYLEKPFSPESLAQAVRAALDD